MWVPEELRTLYHAGPRPRRQPPGHAGHRGHGAARRGRRRRPGRHPAPAADRRPRQRARAGRRRADRPDRARRRQHRARPPRRDRGQRAADAAVVRRAGAGHPRPRRHRRPAAADPRRADPPGARRGRRPPAPRRDAGSRRRGARRDEPTRPGPRAHARGARRDLLAPARAPAAGSAWCRRWAPCTRATPACCGPRASGSPDGPVVVVDLRQPAAVRRRARTSTATRAPSTPTSRSAPREGVDVVFAPVGRGGLPGRRAAGHRRPRPAGHGARGPDPPGPLPRRADRGGQAVRAGPARRRRLRPEGLPAAGADPPDGRRPLPRRRGGRRRDRSASPTAWRCPAATATSTPSSARAGRRPQPRPCARRSEDAAYGVDARWARPAPSCAPPTASTSTTS